MESGTLGRYIKADPSICHGEPTFRGTGILVADVSEQVARGMAWQAIKHEMAEGDHPPVGLLLCTRKNQALMEYALAGMDNQLFVSRYQLELPRREELVALLEAEMRELGAGETDA